LSLYSIEKIRAHIEKTVEKMKADPNFGINHNRASTRQISDFVAAGKVRNHTFISDEPPIRGGTDKGPSPLEYFIAGFSFCQQVIFVLYAARLGIQLDSLEIDADGIVPGRGQYGFKDFKTGIKEIDYRIRIESKENKGSIMKLVDAVEKYCPAINTLKDPPSLKREVILNGEIIG